MSQKLGSDRRRSWLLFSVHLFALLLIFQNCSKVQFDPAPNSTLGSNDAQSVVSKSGQLTVTATHPNPPLDLFFIVDSSASMAVNQSHLAQAFSSIFQSNSGNLADFDANIYLFSTASTVNPSLMSRVPSSPSPADLLSMPQISANGIAPFAPIAGNLFGYWVSSTGAPGSSQYAAQFNPAPVWDLDPQSHADSAYLFLAKKGSQSDADYQLSLNNLTTAFQRRLAYLNPANFTPTDHQNFDGLTDVSSGMCSMARILKHAGNFIHSGDSAAFILVSDDDDRLNVRNPAGNQCVESINNGGVQVVDGSCGHYQSTFKFNTSSTITFQTNSKFTYQSGTSVAYSGASGQDNCSIQFSIGYPFVASYTVVQTFTDVSYTQCNQYADGVNCVKSSPTIATLNGDLTASGNACASSVPSSVNQPAPGTGFSCSVRHPSSTVTKSGNDSASDGQHCSSGLLAQFPSGASCTITGGKVLQTQNVSEAHGNCAKACADAGQSTSSCFVQSASATQANHSFDLAVNVGSCNALCPSVGACGSGSLNDYVSSHYGGTCSDVAGRTSTISVNAAVDKNGNALTLASSLQGLSVYTDGGTLVCAGAATVQDCIAQLQIGAPTQASAALSSSHDDTVNRSVPLNVSCASSCADSAGLCPAGSGTIASWALTQNLACKGSSNGGSKSLYLQFANNTVNCATKCSQALPAGCDGNGWGAKNAMTVADYIAQVQQGGATCSSGGSRFAADSNSSSKTIPAGSEANACASPLEPVFQASGSAYSQLPISYVAGDSNHFPADFQDTILKQLRSVFGNTPITAAAIAHLANDTQLQGTTVSDSYLTLVNNINRAYGNPSQIYDISGDANAYASALGNISQLIVTTTRNSFVLPITASSHMVTVSVKHPADVAWQPLASSQWTWSGQTLSFNASAGLQIGDQVLYDYQVP